MISFLAQFFQFHEEMLIPLSCHAHSFRERPHKAILGSTPRSLRSMTAHEGASLTYFYRTGRMVLLALWTRPAINPGVLRDGNPVKPQCGSDTTDILYEVSAIELY